MEKNDQGQQRGAMRRRDPKIPELRRARAIANAMVRGQYGPRQDIHP
jgi:hypothetical protein